jgi:hypothetical protein
MDLDWSVHSAHIRTLFHPWHQGDGYEEEDIAAAEARCGVRLPATLRSFYRTWGRRRDLTQMNEWLLAPDQWVVHSGALIFCVENQACSYWALPLDALAEADSPVMQAESGPERSLQELQEELDWHIGCRGVSSFLDALTYLHAFSKGAIHGAHSARLHSQPWQQEWLEQNWQQVKVLPLQVLYPEENGLWHTLYVRDGQALDGFDRFFAVASTSEALDEIARALAIEWEESW